MFKDILISYNKNPVRFDAPTGLLMCTDAVAEQCPLPIVPPPPPEVSTTAHCPLPVSDGQAYQFLLSVLVLHHGDDS